MLTLLVLIVLANTLVMPILLLAQGAYHFATVKPVSASWSVWYQELKYNNSMWSLYNNHDGDFLACTYAVGDFIGGIVFLGFLAFFEYWVLIPIICGAILVYLRHLNMKKED